MMTYVHHIPGRIRVRSYAFKAAGASATVSWLQSTPGVRRVEVNPLTGSVLVYYSPDVADVAELIAGLRRRAGSAPRPIARAAAWPASPMGKAVQKAAAKAVVGFAAEFVIERSLVALASALL